MDTAWGRRVYDQYEIGFEVDKPKHSYLSEPSKKINFGHKADNNNNCTRHLLRQAACRGEAARRMAGDDLDTPVAIIVENCYLPKLRESELLMDFVSRERSGVGAQCIRWR